MHIYIYIYNIYIVHLCYVCVATCIIHVIITLIEDHTSVVCVVPRGVMHISQCKSPAGHAKVQAEQLYGGNNSSSCCGTEGSCCDEVSTKLSSIVDSGGRRARHIAHLFTPFGFIKVHRTQAHGVVGRGGVGRAGDVGGEKVLFLNLRAEHV